MAQENTILSSFFLICNHTPLSKVQGQCLISPGVLEAPLLGGSCIINKMSPKTESGVQRDDSAVSNHYPVSFGSASKPKRLKNLKEHVIL